MNCYSWFLWLPGIDNLVSPGPLLQILVGSRSRRREKILKHSILMLIPIRLYPLASNLIAGQHDVIRDVALLFDDKADLLQITDISSNSLRALQVGVKKMSLRLQNAKDLPEERQCVRIKMGCFDVDDDMKIIAAEGQAFGVTFEKADVRVLVCTMTEPDGARRQVHGCDQVRLEEALNNVFRP